MDPRHTARGIVMHDDQLLLIERWRDGLHYFSVPGGGIETGETPEQTVVRELQEETSCQVGVQRKLYVLYLGDTVNHIFLCEYISGTPQLAADSPEAVDMQPNNRFKPVWMPLAEFKDSNFLVWKPIQTQLLHDLSHGFSEQVAMLGAGMVP